jgi:hypothetical protein
VAALEDLHADLFDGGEAEIEGAGIDGEIRTDESGGAVVGADVGPALVEGLAVTGGDDAPAIGPGGGPLEEGIEVAGAGTVAPDPGAVQGLDTVGGLDAGVDVVALTEPQFTPETPVDAIDHLVRIGGAEAAHEEAPRVGLAIAVGVLEMEQLGALGDVESAIAELDPGGHEEALDEFVKFVGLAVVVGVLADEDVVVGLFTGLDLRVAGRAGDPEAAALVPAHLHGLDDAIGLGGEEIHGEAVHDLEGGELLLGRLGFRGGRLDGDGGTDGNGRDRFPGEGGADIGLGLLEEGEELLHFLGEEAFVVVLPIAGVGDIGPVAGEEGPVHGTPVVEPEALELAHLAMGGGEAVVGSRGETESLHDTSGDKAVARLAEVEAVFGEGGTVFTDDGEGDEGEFEFLSDRADREGVGRERGVEGGEIGAVGEVGFLEGDGLEEDDTASALGELGDEGFVGGDEGGEAVGTGEAFHLPELGEDDGGSGVGELLIPIALLPPRGGAGLLLDAFFGLAAFRVELFDITSVAPLFEDGVALPAEIADAKGAVGKGGDELGLEPGVKAGAFEVRPAREGDGVVGFHERLGVERAREEEEKGEEFFHRFNLLLILLPHTHTQIERSWGFGCTTGG